MAPPTVFIVDDDPGIRYSLETLLLAIDQPVQCFAGAEEFLRTFDPERAGCVVLDVRMPDMDGMKLHEALRLRGNRLPVIFLSAYGDLDIGITAMKQGALDFLTKPIQSQTFLEHVRAALLLDAKQQEVQAKRCVFKRGLDKLTHRELEVLELALLGKSSQAIAEQLKISRRTVEGHRVQIYLKLDVGSLVELSQQAASIGAMLFKRAHSA